jgi:hypothetical protein
VFRTSMMVRSSMSYTWLRPYLYQGHFHVGETCGWDVTNPRLSLPLCFLLVSSISSHKCLPCTHLYKYYLIKVVDNII